jgi:hypothetical protein
MVTGGDSGDSWHIWWHILPISDDHVDRLPISLRHGVVTGSRAKKEAPHDRFPSVYVAHVKGTR